MAGLGVSHVVAGYDFVFGHKRGGDIGLLYQKARTLGFGVTEVKPASDTEGGVFSSTPACATCWSLASRGSRRGAGASVGAGRAGRAWRPARPDHRLSDR